MISLFPVTAFTLGWAALLLGGLLLVVVRQRLKHRVGLGDGGEQALERAIRAHANAAENLPLLCLLVAAIEATAALSNALMMTASIVLACARLAHAIGVYRFAGPSQSRFLGTLVTVLFYLFSGLLLLGLSLRLLF